jgi:hypothetical protein
MAENLESEISIFEIVGGVVFAPDSRLGGQFAEL